MSDNSKEFMDDLRYVAQTLVDMLAQKNALYGDSVLNPVRTFSKASVEDLIDVRMDDKLSRLRAAGGLDKEDAELDLLGYLVLKRIAKLRAKRRQAEQTSGQQAAAIIQEHINGFGNAPSAPAAPQGLPPAPPPAAPMPRAPLPAAKPLPYDPSNPAGPILGVTFGDQEGRA